MKVNQSIVLTASTLRKASRIAERIEKRTTTFNEANAADAAAFLELTGQTFGAQVTAATVATSSGKGKRVMSAATKAKIAAGQAARWAKVKVATQAPAPASAPATTPAQPAPTAAK